MNDEKIPVPHATSSIFLYSGVIKLAIFCFHNESHPNVVYFTIQSVTSCILFRKKLFCNRLYIMNQFCFTILLAYIILYLYKNIQGLLKFYLLISFNNKLLFY